MNQSPVYKDDQVIYRDVSPMVTQGKPGIAATIELYEMQTGNALGTLLLNKAQYPDNNPSLLPWTCPFLDYRSNRTINLKVDTHLDLSHYTRNPVQINFFIAGDPKPAIMVFVVRGRIGQVQIKVERYIQGNTEFFMPTWAIPRWQPKPKQRLTLKHPRLVWYGAAFILIAFTILLLITLNLAS